MRKSAGRGACASCHAADNSARLTKRAGTAGVNRHSHAGLHRLEADGLLRVVDGRARHASLGPAGGRGSPGLAREVLGRAIAPLFNGT